MLLKPSFLYPKISSGVKIGALSSLLLDNAESAGSLFLRVDELSVAASASALASLNFNLFNEISVSGGSFSLSLGMQLSAPFETELGKSTKHHHNLSKYESLS